MTPLLETGRKSLAGSCIWTILKDQEVCHSADSRKPLFLSRDEQIDLRNVRGAKTRKWPAHACTANGTTLHENVFADSQTDTRLLLIANKRKKCLEDIPTALDIAFEKGTADTDHHLRVGKAGHRAVGTASQLLC